MQLFQTVLKILLKNFSDLRLLSDKSMFDSNMMSPNNNSKKEQQFLDSQVTPKMLR